MLLGATSTLTVTPAQEGLSEIQIKCFSFSDFLSIFYFILMRYHCGINVGPSAVPGGLASRTRGGQ